MSKQPLLQSLNLGDLLLNNRVVMAPMTRSRADNPENAPTAIHAEYYRQRASAGLIITEGSQISKKAVGYINTPGIYSEAQVEGWKKVTQAVHDEGGKIFIQLWHVGRISHPDFHGGDLPHAPSAINPNAKSYTPKGFKETVTPKEMTLEDIQQTILDFRNAAKNAWAAGFDGVEIHSSNGYLLHQFFSRTSNVRTDAYGGSIENRAKILFEIIDAIKQEIPENRIGLRLNPSLHGIFGMTMDEESIPTFDYIIEKLNEYDLAYLHLSEPFNDVSEVPFAEPEIAKRYRPVYKGTLIINANFDQEEGNRYVLEGLADAVAFGKPYISNPDLVERFEAGAELAEWDQDTFYTQGEKGYTDYPTYQEEKV
ncbi:Flavoprotein NADH-dependent oxidoreductase [Indibacter alkaliphilus LW1]|uniref:Flavoprotein NADH-dependent oxidoreductase n=1 Tax=Indibacter alkaliphilus (strain CCUG 57479 / KCTC 22604 / LW1) TaxID=1189612 RepID=S2DR86_INDAL|nr:alkene reductase [Indibacter alkaliphilus]EOZ92408.1 Flavoprotein NADH-dependent oxidoreductase [Indibacter alkaliphilus LW1]